MVIARPSTKTSEKALLSAYPKPRLKDIKEACEKNKEEIIKCLETTGLIKYDAVRGFAGYILEDGKFCVISKNLGFKEGKAHSTIDLLLAKNKLLPGPTISYKETDMGSVAMYYLNAVRYNYKLFEHYIDIERTITDDQLESVARLLDLFAINKTTVDINYFDESVETYDFNSEGLIVDDIIKNIRIALQKEQLVEKN